MKGRTSGANVERKPSLIKDKGISATSRLVVTTTSASHSLQHPLSEKPSFLPCSPLRSRPPLSLARSMTHRDTAPESSTIRQYKGKGRLYSVVCCPCLFTLRPRTLSTKQGHFIIARNACAFFLILIIFKKLT